MEKKRVEDTGKFIDAEWIVSKTLPGEWDRWTLKILIFLKGSTHDRRYSRYLKTSQRTLKVSVQQQIFNHHVYVLLKIMIH